MKSAKAIANIAVLSFTLWFNPGASAQQKAGAQKPAPSKPAAQKAASSQPAVKAPKPAAAHKPAAPATAKVIKAAVPDTAEPIVSRRDPFAPLVYLARAGSGGPEEHLPPGKAGLVVSTVRVDGALKSPNGMIAVVSNPQQRVYFVREGDHLYDGYVEKISLEGVTFKENSKDAFGKAVERLVTKRIYPSAGEQQ